MKKSKGVILSLLFVLIILMFSFSVFGVVNTACSKAGVYAPTKLPGGELEFSGIYQSPTGFNTTQIFFYYPSISTANRFYNTSVMNTPNAISFVTTDFTLLPDITRIYYNATLKNSTSGVAAWECEYVVITAASGFTRVLKPLFTIIFSIAALLGFLGSLYVMYKNNFLNPMTVTFLIIGFIILTALLLSMIPVIFT